MKLDKFLADGGLLVDGDKLHTAYEYKIDGEDAKAINSEGYEPSEKTTITHFTWRDNTCEKPAYKGRIEVELLSGAKESQYKAANYYWKTASVKRWRPVFDAESPVTNKADYEGFPEGTEVVKPFPQVGDKCVVISKPCKLNLCEGVIKYLSFTYVIISVDGDERHYYKAAVTIKPISEKTDTEKAIESLAGALGAICPLPEVVNETIDAIKAKRVHGVKWEGES